MATKIKIPFTDGHCEVHFDGLTCSSTLCGQDYAGDKEWGVGEPTEERVDCEQCIHIVAFCKTIRSTEMVKI